MTGLHPALSKALALTLLAALLGALWIGVAAPIAGAFADLDARKTELEALRERYLAAAARRDERETELNALKQRAVADSILIDEPNASLAAASIQTEVNEIVAEAGGKLRRVTVLTAEPGEAYEKIGLRLLFTIDTPGLVEILEMLEIESTAYRVGDIQVQGAAPRRSSRTADANIDSLTVQLDLFGFRRVEE